MTYYMVTYTDDVIESDSVRNESWTVRRDFTELVDHERLWCLCSTHRVMLKSVQEMRAHGAPWEPDAVKRYQVDVAKEAAMRQAATEAKQRLEKAQAAAARAAADLEEIEARNKGQIP